MSEPANFDLTWSSPPDGVYLTGADVHVWLIRLDDSGVGGEYCERLLSADEHERASRFKFDRDRRRYVMAHAGLRSILALYSMVPPQHLEFFFGPNGKPKLAPIPGTETVQFNLSHSHEVALVAVTRKGEIGVDVEYVKEDFPFAEVAQRFFSPKEVAAFVSLPKRLQPAAFYKCWTSKESFLKAKGTGLSGALDEVDLVLSRNGEVRVTGTIPDWALTELAVSQDYIAALVVEGEKRRPKTYRWKPHESSPSR